MAGKYFIPRYGCILLFALVCLVAIGGNAAAQPYPDSKGTDFWFTFMPNFHNGYDSLDLKPELRLQHEIYIYISADKATRGTITLTNRNGVQRIEPFNIPAPSQIFEFHTFFKPYELVGFNRGMVIDYANMQTETIAEQTVHVTSEDDVTVYALNQAALTSDAFLVLPTDALAEDYVVASYTSDIDWTSPLMPSPVSTSTPSQFCIVATQDGTEVEIVPTAPTFLSPLKEPQTISLNKGQVYLVQVDPRLTLDGDLTGTVIRASLPVAVFGGHQRAIVPIEDQTFLGSRDCLIEQMNPIRTWGKSAFVFPFTLSADEVTNSTSRFRVIAAFDSTQVEVGNVLVAQINKGEFYEGILDSAKEVRSTKPVMVSMLKKTAGSGTGVNAVRLGDPFMMLVPPAEQFMDTYRFVNIQAYEYIYNPMTQQIIQGQTIYKEQYLAVVIANEGLPTLSLDGTLIGGAGFSPIPNTGYSWQSMRMSDGIHNISADTTFGIYVYGYGEANSYGYIGGMSFRPLDVQPPNIGGSPVCGVFDGVITDSIIGDTRVKSARILPGSEINVVATIAPFTPPQRVVQFSATLIDPYDDGSFSVEATDNARQTSSESYSVPGFTVGAVGQGTTNTPVLISTIIAQDHQRCDTLHIVNYGKFPHVITGMHTSKQDPVIVQALPIVLGAGDTLEVLVCQQFDSAGMQIDTLFIEDGCTSRPTYQLATDVRADKEPPYTTLSRAACSLEYLATVSDDRQFDYGLRSSTIMEDYLVNCSVTERERTAYWVTYQVVVADPLFDAVYGITSTDSAGNTVEFIDTIPGFTLAFDSSGDYFQSVRLPSEHVGSVLCDTIWISNYGMFPHLVDKVIVYGNIIFSVPQDQLPFVVLPGGHIPLTVCYEPRMTSDLPDVDTLQFYNGCITKEVEVQAIAKATMYAGLSRCDVGIVSSQFAVGGALKVSPNPATDMLNLELSRSTPTLTVRLLSLVGVEVMRKTWQGATSTLFQMNLAGTPAGTYVVIAEYPLGTESTVVTFR